jgi:outer membrane protein assembly factor BamD (BamD/ComL family)
MLSTASSIPDLEAIVSDYPETQTAEMALIAVAKQYFDNANYEVAFTKYEDFIRDYTKSPLIKTAKLGRIFCIEARNNDAALQEAANEYAAFTKEYTNSFLAPQSIFGQARCLEHLNQLEEARIVYEDFIANQSDSPWLLLAEDLLKQLTRKIGNEPTTNDSIATTAPVTKVSEE